MATEEEAADTLYNYPDAVEFKAQYMAHMDDAYLAEKTLPTVLQWMAGKQSTHDGRTIVALYAYHDLVKLLTREYGPSSIVILSAQNNAERIITKIAGALGLIAQPIAL